MKIKTKLNLSIGFLFLMIILLIAVGVRYINALSNDTQNILVANYNTIDYARQMLIALDEDITSEKSIAKFESNLEKQQKNITETGEQELTNKLFLDFEKLKKSHGDSLLFASVRKDLTSIMLLNMEAIQRKSAVAAKTAKSATTVIGLTGTVCFFLAFTLLLNLPGSIANPIKELTESIKGIAAKNYSQRVHFESHNEFGELAHSFNAMAKKLEEYNNSNLAKLMMEKRRIETLINNMHDPIIGFDDKRNIIFVNTSAVKVLGTAEKDLVGKYAPDVALKNDLLRNLINTDSGVKPLKIYADNKESYFTKEVLQIISDEQPVGQVIMLKNVTQFKELDVSKTNFIATISHELKTPISSIKMSLKLLNDKRVGELNEEQRQLIENINSDTSRLLKITGELLDLTQVESGKIHLEKESVEPKAIINYAYSALKFQAEQKQITIDIRLEEDLPKVICDMEKTAWVMVNFLSNAIRYTPEKSKVIVEAKKENNKVIFLVKDSGKGIAAIHRERIFEKFYQVPNTETGKTGTGLGLAISKDFIEAQGGKIWMESEIGAGSTFSFSLNT